MTHASLTRRRAVRDGLLLAGLILNLTLLVAWSADLDLWIDAHSWERIDLNDLYGTAEESLRGIGPFRYAPVIAWLLYPVSRLPWPAIVAVWTAMNLAALVILGRRSTVLLLIGFPPILLELLNGNIHLFMALAVWAGMRWPIAWAFILLTKVTPGVGVLWFAARHEWRQLGIALGGTAAIVVAGSVLAPDQWGAWVGMLAVSSGMSVSTPLPPLAVRLPIAAAVVLFAGRTDRAWLVPVGVVIAMPTIWLQSTAILTACFPLWAERARWKRPLHAVAVVEPVAEAAT